MGSQGRKENGSRLERLRQSCELPRAESSIGSSTSVKALEQLIPSVVEVSVYTSGLYFSYSASCIFSRSHMVP